jgi:hypothetical protein
MFRERETHLIITSGQCIQFDDQPVHLYVLMIPEQKTGKDSTASLLTWAIGTIRSQQFGE